MTSTKKASYGRGRPRTRDVLFSKWRIERVERLIPYAANARKHSAAQIDKIAASIKRFGFTSPILVADRNVIAGHGRLLAAKKLGMETVPTIQLAHLTAEERRAYRLLDNQLATLSSWDEALKGLELGELHDSGFGDLAAIGFSARELASLWGEGEGDAVGDAKGDAKDDGTRTVTFQTKPRAALACPECGHTFTP